MRAHRLTDTAFTIETPELGEVTWNVTLMKIQIGLKDPAIARRKFLTRHLQPPAYEKGNVERARIEFIKKHREFLDDPAIAIGSPNDDPNNLYCFVDGNHRICARQELQLETFETWVIPWQMEKNFRVVALSLPIK